jgi:hypothetical protein
MVTMKNGVFWDVMPCGSSKNRCFGGTSVLTRATRRNIPEGAILHIITHIDQLVWWLGSYNFGGNCQAHEKYSILGWGGGEMGQLSHSLAVSYYKGQMLYWSHSLKHKLQSSPRNRYDVFVCVQEQLRVIASHSRKSIMGRGVLRTLWTSVPMCKRWIWVTEPGLKEVRVFRLSH